MIEFAGAVFLVIGFIIFMKLFSLVEKSSKVVNISKSAVKIIRNRSLNDYQKEIAMQQYAKELMSLFFLITIGSIFSVMIPFGFIWLMDAFGILSIDEVIQTTLSLEFIIITLIITVVYFWITRGENGKFRK